MERLRNIKIVDKKLGRQQSFGLWHPEGLIEIDSRLRGRDRLIVLIHELLHEAQPYLDEEEVDKVSTYIGERVFEQGYVRKTEV